MPVLIEAISVITRVDAINQKFPGGWEAFVDDCPNQTLCSDNALARVGFMSPVDVEYYIQRLERLGLIYQDDQQEAVDIVVVDQLRGPLAKCSWIETGHIDLDNNPKQKVAAARLIGDESLVFMRPDDWNFEESLSNQYGFTPTESVEKSLTFLRHQDGLDVYLNKLTGEEVFIGRTGEK